MDPDQTAPRIWVHTVCLYAKLGLKSLQEYSADDINRRHFQMQFFLGALTVKAYFLGYQFVVGQCTVFTICIGTYWPEQTV